MSKLPAYTFSTKEINFLAEQEPLTILPRYTMNGTTLIGAKLPNLKALQREQVPVWLALILKKQDKCNVVIPDWLNVGFLKQRYDEEVRQPHKFSELPWHWLPLSKLLLERCSDDFIEPPHEIRALIQDLREVRQLKARKGIRELNDEYIQLDGLSLMEINEIRPFVVQVMDQLRILMQSVSAQELPGSSSADAGVGEDGIGSKGYSNEANTTVTEDSVAKTSYYDTVEDDEDSDVEYRVKE